MTFTQGSLWQSVMQTTERALRTGALIPIPTEYAFIEDAGVRFSVRVLASLRRKDEARTVQEAAAAAGLKANPFLPPEKELTVSEITDTHVAVLNKFNVVERHLLIITRHYEDQDTLLTPADFEALWLCMAEYEGLGFYNGGREAGASQQHKHLQMVPIPLAPEGPAVPVASLLAEAPPAGLGTVPGFPFLHAFVRLDRELVETPRDAALLTYDCYREMLARVGMRTPDRTGLTTQSLPYCFLVSRDWMLLVPRSREHFEDISLNSLSYAGSFFVRDKGQLERLRIAGPINALRSVGLPPMPGRH